MAVQTSKMVCEATGKRSRIEGAPIVVLSAVKWYEEVNVETSSFIAFVLLALILAPQYCWAYIPPVRYP